MEYHRNPSPPDSPTPPACACTICASGQSHDITITSSTDTAQPDSASHDNDDSTSLVNYDDRIGDTVFSKAWVLSLLVKAVEAVREQESKIEVSNHTEDNLGECDTEKLELSVEKRPSILSSRTVQSDAQVMGMESQECDQPDPRDRPIQDASSEPEQNDCLLEANSGDASTETRTKEDQREMQISRNDEDNSMQRTEKESMICETSPVDSKQEEGETRGERGEDKESDGDEGDDGLFDVRERSLSDGAEEISESLENDLCRLWDASMNMEVAQFIHEQRGVELLLGVANRSTAPRLTEICIGLLGNMACSENICIQGLSSSSETVQMLIQFMESSDTRILYEISRLIVTCLSHEKAHPVWLKEIQQSEVMYPAMIFILQGSTNTELLQSVASLLDRLLDSCEQLLMEWATRELVEAMCEAAEQVRVSCVDATCSLLMILQLLSTVDEGVEAIIGCESKVFPLLCSFLTGLDHLEGHCSPVMAAISLFIALKENSNSDQVKYSLTDADLIESIQSISKQAKLLSEQLNASRTCQYSQLYALTLQLL